MGKLVDKLSSGSRVWGFRPCWFTNPQCDPRNSDLEAALLQVADQLNAHPPTTTESDVPAMVVLGELDPITPTRWAQATSEHLDKG
jgi:hypothetical protein